MFLHNKIILMILRLKKSSGGEFNFLPCIYWFPKMHKIPSGLRFVMAGKKLYIYVYTYIYIYIYIYIYNAEINDKEYYFFRNSKFHAACATIFSRMNYNGQICYNIKVSYFA